MRVNDDLPLQDRVARFRRRAAYGHFMGFFYLYYAFGLPAFLSITIALYLLFTGANSSLIFLKRTRVVDLYFVCAGSGEAFNVGQFLEETSPYLWASTGIGFCIGFSVLGAGWCVLHTNYHHRCAWRAI